MNQDYINKRVQEYKKRLVGWNTKLLKNDCLHWLNFWKYELNKWNSSRYYTQTELIHNIQLFFELYKELDKYGDLIK